MDITVLTVAMSLTGTPVIGGTDLSDFPKFRSALARRDAASMVSEERRAVLDKAVQGMTPEEVLRKINKLVNDAIRYVPDAINYGVKDYWAAPWEALERGGDCEDYALAKYAVLSDLEYEAVLVVGQDTSLPENRQGHAWLVVRADEINYVLDNRWDHLMPVDSAPKLIPFYAVWTGGWVVFSQRKDD